jgi:hypothetical protein
MSDYGRNSEAGRKWLPWFRQIFEEGLDDPVEDVTRLVLALASGQADVLSGCTLSIADDLTELVKQMEAIEKDKLYTLKLDTLSALSVMRNP